MDTDIVDPAAEAYHAKCLLIIGSQIDVLADLHSNKFRHPPPHEWEQVGDLRRIIRALGDALDAGGVGRAS